MPSHHGKQPTLLLCILVLASPSLAWEVGYPFRRAVDVEFPAERSPGDELALVDIYTAGHHQPAREIVRATTDDGKLTPSRLLMTGPGDKIRLAFAPKPPVKRYYVYFGNPKPPAPRPTDELLCRSGLLLEMRRLDTPGQSGNLSRIDQVFNNNPSVVGRTIIDRLYLGLNPFGQQVEIISRYAGTLHAPVDGTYTFAASVSDRGALFLDGKSILLVPNNPGDTRHNTRIDLKRGKHDIAFYHVNIAGEQRLSVAWKRPDSNSFEVIPAEAFGLLAKTTPGPLEQKDKNLTSDFKIEYTGECYYADHYSHRYRFTALLPKASSSPRFDWDFGNGQTASGPVAEQVYLTDAEYPVKLTTRNGLQTDAQTNRLAVSRDYEHLDKPADDLWSRQAAIVAKYDLAKLPTDSLTYAVLLHVRTRGAEPLATAATFLAANAPGKDTRLALRTLQDASNELLRQSRLDLAARVWDPVTPDSPLQPQAASSYANILLWRTADFAKAANILETQTAKHPNDHTLLRNYAHALLLNQNPDEAKRILLRLPAEGPPDRQAAVTGALARTIEFYIAEKDAETGENSWLKWQEQYPADFLEGYSLLLQTRLMELNGSPAAAAKVAAAFAAAMPRSSYAPTLLDRASKLIEKLDPKKSKNLRDLLKQKYPEDPLSQ